MEGSTDLITTLRKQLDPKKSEITLFVVDVEHYQSTVIDLCKFIVVENKIPGVYINLNKPFSVVREKFERHGINPNNMIFIDGVTSISEESKRTENCLYLGSSQNLTDISIAASEAVEAIPGQYRSLFLDSVNTLLIYNDEPTVLRFLRFLIGKMRRWSVVGVLIVLKEESRDDLVRELSQTVDKVFTVGGEKK